MSGTWIVIFKFIETVIQLTDLATRYGLCESRRVKAFSFFFMVSREDSTSCYVTTSDHIMLN